MTAKNLQYNRRPYKKAQISYLVFAFEADAAVEFHLFDVVPQVVDLDWSVMGVPLGGATTQRVRFHGRLVITFQTDNLS